MNILLTHGYYLNEDKKEAKIMKPYPPLGLLYVSSFLKENGLKNKVFDSTFSSLEKQLQWIAENQPKIVGIYTNLMTKINVIKLVKLLKNDPEFGLPHIILGGPDVTFNCKNYLNSGADFLVIGEGEETMYELCSALIANDEYQSIKGIAYLVNGQLIRTSTRSKIKDLKNLPFPNRAAIDFKPYLDTWKTYHGKSSMTISTQRGCPYTCKWCSTAVYGQSYRRRPAKQVVEEIKLILDTYHPDALWFVDDVFTVSHKWIDEFHKEMTTNHLNVPFEIITRAERLNERVLKQLKDIGCFRIWIGAESGSQTVIDAMDRRVEIETVKQMIQKTNAFGMETGTFIMLGYPGETEADIKETIQYLKEANPTHYTITVAYPIKGTSLYEDIEDHIIHQPHWETSTDRQIDFKRTYRRKYYDYAVKKVINEVEFERTKTFSRALIHKVKSTLLSLIMLSLKYS
ncbi:B12-binding domain-containing radical SAM protein [Aestuariivivens sediminis]|uniref:B12-binding domain-containing radical SAM protein n=1 Tax=Aestuariivivens sediminis TaxID=2913557 RepID=UPI001F5983C2|nr:radical SAM protein [Aestuariivivens sediminis]